MDEGKKPEARDVLISQSSKVSIHSAMKIKLVVELQMMLPSGRRTPNDIGSLLSHRRYHPVLFGSHPNKSVNLPSP